MTHELDRALLRLSLEVSSAKEALAATEAFGRFFRERYQPTKMRHYDLDQESDEAKKFGQEKLFFKKDNTYIFRIPFLIPIIFELEGVSADVPHAEEIEVLRKIASFFREKMETVTELKGLTYTDDLTGLYNQRYLELVLERELSLAKRNSTEFSVLFLDLDHFKNVNDTHGHLIGSRLLFEVGQEIKRALRESDITFRYGGDEFVMILSHTGLDDAVFVAERIRTQIEKKRFLVKDGMEIRLTASIGVATVPEHAETKQQILKAADEALYGVKKAVRNKVIAAASKFKE